MPSGRASSSPAICADHGRSSSCRRWQTNGSSFTAIAIPWFVYVALCGVATLFGAWEGGLIGVEKENKKLERFHDDIEAGKFLILIYARRDQESVVRHMMSRRHPEADFAGLDSHFVNPFTAVRRRRTSGDRVRA